MGGKEAKTGLFLTKKVYHVSNKFIGNKNKKYFRAVRILNEKEKGSKDAFQSPRFHDKFLNLVALAVRTKVQILVLLVTRTRKENDFREIFPLFPFKLC